MFTSLFLGISFFMMGIFHWRGSEFMLSRKTMRKIKPNQLKDFQKGEALGAFSIGIIFIVMGIVENIYDFETSTILIIYAILLAIPFRLFLVNNKKYSGNYWLW